MLSGMHILLIMSIVHELLMRMADAQRELRLWREDRIIECKFCLDYDDYRRLSIFGCAQKQTPTCAGNACYMRQHKKGEGEYFLETSGCLNLTQHQFNNIRNRTRHSRVERGANGNETQLCEVSQTMNTCLCANKPQCNKMNSLESEPFTEYTAPIFDSTNFDELAHFRSFLPNDPILSPEDEHQRGEKYFLIKSVPSSIPSTTTRFSRNFLLISMLLLYICPWCLARR